VERGLKNIFSSTLFAACRREGCRAKQRPGESAERGEVILVIETLFDYSGGTMFFIPIFSTLQKSQPKNQIFEKCY
jgi:hypothetical protein